MRRSSKPCMTRDHQRFLASSTSSEPFAWCLYVHPEDQHLLGMKHLGQFYVDCALPFGGRSCAKIFNECADLACFDMAKSAGSTSLTHYSDDFLSLSGNPDLALPEFNSILSTAEDMGIPLKQTKTQFPSSSVRFIGWILDAPSMTISLPGKVPTVGSLVCLP